MKLRPQSATALSLVLLALAGPLLSGCRHADGETTPTLHPVTGRVLMADGKPLTTGSIVFVPIKGSTHQASAPLNSDGTFSLGTNKEKDGAAPGEYAVMVDLTMGVDSKKKAPKVHPKFTDYGTSGWTAVVEAKSNDLPTFQMTNK